MAEERLHQLQMQEAQQLKLRELQLQDDFEREKSWRLEQGREMLKATEPSPPPYPGVDIIDAYVLPQEDVVDRGSSRVGYEDVVDRGLSRVGYALPEDVVDRSVSRESAYSPSPSLVSEQSIPCVEK